jgi:hypothetical protein
MRSTPIATATLVAALASVGGCGKPTDHSATATTAPPARKAGLWAQTMTRDGKPGKLGVLKVCLDPATDARLSVFGRHFGQANCPHALSRDDKGAYHFQSTCTLKSGGVLTSRGVATGDFGSGYEVHSEVTVRDAPLEAMNGLHSVTITGRYRGPCPADMRPGDIDLGSGIRVSVDRLAQIAGAIEGNGS